ncbi:hypothetical protein TcasGA2_TC003188 [Tribolium castaneum]|uniref:Uncharacterized protein n=1 Tax=Tribolium castaneum TaxID=7070 RepID=D6WEH5_TRICA|nr:hypothetical protein TcasGA2_TC003188 [Tribolium castaneum]
MFVSIKKPEGHSSMEGMSGDPANAPTTRTLVQGDTNTDGMLHLSCGGDRIRKKTVPLMVYMEKDSDRVVRRTNGICKLQADTQIIRLCGVMLSHGVRLRPTPCRTPRPVYPQLLERKRQQPEALTSTMVVRLNRHVSPKQPSGEESPRGGGVPQPQQHSRVQPPAEGAAADRHSLVIAAVSASA